MLLPFMSVTFSYVGVVLPMPLQSPTADLAVYRHVKGVKYALVAAIVVAIAKRGLGGTV
jgi:hypothetical protein